MSKKAVAAYRRENPGSKLKTAVTGKVKKGSKDAKRRKSFCARSKGQQDMHNIDCSKTPKKPVCKDTSSLEVLNESSKTFRRIHSSKRWKWI